MKLKNLIALAAVAAPAFADLSATEDLTSRGGDLVKNRWGECVTVNANKGLRDCGVKAPEPPPPVMETQREVITLGADTYFDFDKSNLKPAGKEAVEPTRCQYPENHRSRSHRLQGFRCLQPETF